MSLDLAGRRALLKQALSDADPDSFAAFDAACAGASEQERAALTRTLPATRLFRTEKITGRAMYVVAALGTPSALADALGVEWRSEQHKLALARRDLVIAAVTTAVRGRDESWLLAGVEALSQVFVEHVLIEPLVTALVDQLGYSPATTGYLKFLLRCAAYDPETLARRSGAEIRAWSVAHPTLLEREFWEIFRVEGMGSAGVLTDYSGWTDAVGLLLTDPAFRTRLIDESLAGLLRDFPAKSVSWYVRVHRLANPTLPEVAARADRYLAVLATAPSTAVGLAQDLLAPLLSANEVVSGLDPEALINASPVVLLRREKKLIKSQLGLLRALVSSQPEKSESVAAVVAPVLEELPSDLARLACTLVDSDDLSVRVGPASQNNPDASELGEHRDIPAPALKPIPCKENRAVSAASLDDTTLFELVGQHLEGAGDGADLPRILASLGMAGPGLGAGGDLAVPSALADRARQVIAAAYPDFSQASPRVQLAALLLRHDNSRPATQSIPPESGMAEPPAVQQFQGYRRFDFHKETSRDRDGFSIRRIPSHSPAALLVSQFYAVPCTEPVPPHTRQWRAELVQPGGGLGGGDDPVFGLGPKQFWLAVGEPPLAAENTVAERLLDVCDVAAEFGFRAEEARGEDGYPQIVQWAGWMLQDNPDTLAAHFHPALYAAIRVVNVRGIEQLCEALGGTCQVPGPPTYSALALALSAKEAPHRASAAEAVAALAQSGLLDPELLAAHLDAHLQQQTVLAGRLAQALADSAGIAALSGYRVLQTLIALLPCVGDIARSAPLVDLTARLADAYGASVEIPKSLTNKAQGRSVMARALQALAAIRQRPTALAWEAAEQSGSGAAGSERTHR